MDRDKDYIATPKANGYRSLHSTLLVPSLTVDVLPESRAVSFDSGLGISDRQPEDGLPLELQIRTTRKCTSDCVLLLLFSALLPHQCLAGSCLHTWFGLIWIERASWHAGMHEEAQSGEAAHAAYKGGLAPGLARRLQSFLELAARPPVLPTPAFWNSSEAAAEELFR